MRKRGEVCKVIGVGCMILGLFISPLAYGQTKNYIQFAKTWNYLKYYHPDLATGKINADSLFLAHVSAISASSSEEEATGTLLSSVPAVTAVAKLPAGNPKEIFSVNRDFSWYLNNPSIGSGNKEKLTSIFNGRYTGDNHFFLAKTNWESEFPNEKKYDLKPGELPPLPYRLLTFAKIQGAVDFLYPYRYLMPVSLDRLSLNLLPRLIACNTLPDYERLLAEMVASFEDTHAFGFYSQLYSRETLFYSAYYPPFDYQVRDQYILITAIIDTARCLQAELKTGDRIMAVNDVGVPALLREKKKLLSVSNEEVLRYRLSEYSGNLVWNNTKPENLFTILRGKKRGKRQVSFIAKTDTQGILAINSYFQKHTAPGITELIRRNDIGYFKVDHLFHLIETVDDNKVDALMDSVFDAASKRKNLVFDMRGYPDWGGFFHTYVYRYFSKKDNYFHKAFFPDRQNIGTWKYQPGSEHYFPDIAGKTQHKYEGNVFILTNYRTLSMSEFYTMSLQYIFPNAITVGRQTAGADGNVRTMILPGGYKLSFTGFCIFYPDGGLSQKTGVRIHRKIKYTDADFINNTDAEMRAVESMTRNKK